VNGPEKRKLLSSAYRRENSLSLQATNIVPERAKKSRKVHTKGKCIEEASETNELNTGIKIHIKRPKGGASHTQRFLIGPRKKTLGVPEEIIATLKRGGGNERGGREPDRHVCKIGLFESF